MASTQELGEQSKPKEDLLIPGDRAGRGQTLPVCLPLGVRELGNPSAEGLPDTDGKSLYALSPEGEEAHELLIGCLHRGDSPDDYPQYSGPLVITPTRSPEPKTALAANTTYADYQVETTEPPFSTLPEYKTTYSRTIVHAIAQLYEEYRVQFRRLIEKNREWSTDYQYLLDEKGNPIICAVQIDMSGFPPEFLEIAQQMSIDDVREIIRGRIFEIENSLAMYQLLMGLFRKSPEDKTFFERQFRDTLDDIRSKTGKKIAIVAVTQGKYEAMKESEFGKRKDEPLADEEVERLSGFDRMFSPEGLAQYRAEHGEESEYLFYVRSSDPLEKLKHPDGPEPETILTDPAMRRYIKRYAITPNIDNPDADDSQRINDTKEYMPGMGLAVQIDRPEGLTNLYSNEVRAALLIGQLQLLLPNKAFFTEELKQTACQTTGEGFTAIFNGKASPEATLGLYQLIVASSPEEIFTPKGLKQIREKGVDISDEVETSFVIKLLSHPNQKIASSAVKRMRRVLENIPPERRLSRSFQAFLTARRVDPLAVARGEIRIRFKPMLRGYGAYGHHRIKLNSPNGLSSLIADLQSRGPYVAQEEMRNPIVIINNGPQVFIDRVFLGMTDGQCRFMGGFRTLMPLDCKEARKNNIHGNRESSYASVLPEPSI